MTVPIYLEDYIGTTHTYKSKYEKDTKIYMKYFTYTLPPDILLDFKDAQGQIVGYKPIEIYDHIYTIFLMPEDNNQDITRTENTLQDGYNHDKIF